MPRHLRLFVPGLTQHVIQRGNNRVEIFGSSRDYEVFLSMTHEVVLEHRLEIHAYALMPNHVHFMITSPTADALSAAMQAIGRRYVPYFNRRHERTGGLFEGRYRSFIIDEERYWVSCMRYIELNPMRAGLVSTPEAYRWTSYRAHAMGESNVLVTDHPMYRQLGDTSAERSRSWRAFCAQSIPDAELSELRDAVQQGGILRGLDPQRAQGVRPRV